MGWASQLQGSFFGLIKVGLTFFENFGESDTRRADGGHVAPNPPVHPWSRSASASSRMWGLGRFVTRCIPFGPIPCSRASHDVTVTNVGRETL